MQQFFVSWRNFLSTKDTLCLKSLNTFARIETGLLSFLAISGEATMKSTLLSPSVKFFL